MERISEHISYSEATKSITAMRLGIDNNPGAFQLRNMRELAVNVFEPLRTGLHGRPIRINSFYRSRKLNWAIGGALNSQHMAENGAAIDLDSVEGSGVTNRDIFFYILNNLPFDQLIWEHGNDDQPDWVHVSYKSFGNRWEALKAIYDKEKHKTIYSPF
jgi:zinc D-Ala-D-Ala carboxypeptidase